MKSFLCLLAAAVLLCGCASTVKYAPPNKWGSDVRTLGTVTAESGGWPLSLKVPPPEYTYASALRTKAAKDYNVPAREVVLDEMTVSFMSEIDGTIRSWKASALAGHKPQEK